MRPAISRWGTGFASTPFGAVNTTSNFFRAHSGQASSPVEGDGGDFGMNPTLNSGSLNFPSSRSIPAVQVHNNQRSVSDTSSESSFTGQTANPRNADLHAPSAPMSLHDFANPQSLGFDSAMAIPTPILPTKVNIPMPMQPILPTKVNLNRSVSTPGVQQMPMTGTIATKVSLPSTQQTPNAAPPSQQPILPTKVVFSSSSSATPNHYRNKPDPQNAVPNRIYYRDQTPKDNSRVASNSSDAPAVESAPTAVVESPHASTPAQKGRKGKKSSVSNKDSSTPQRKKRGDWRVKGYRADPSASPAPELAANQVQNKGRHNSAFKAHGYQSSFATASTTPDATTIVDLTDFASVVHTDVSAPIESMPMENFPDQIHDLQMTGSIEPFLEEPQSNTLPSSPAVHMENSFSETLVSRGSSNSLPLNLGTRDHQSPFTDSNVDPLNDSGPSTIPTQQVPTVRLVSVVIEDNRYEDSDEQLVEMKLLLKPAKGEGFWTDANDVCSQLQHGPSRIDGELYR